MQAKSEEIVGLIFIPNDSLDDSPRLFNSVLSAFESVLPADSLHYSIDDFGGIHPVTERGGWIVQQLAGGTSALVCNGNENRLVSVTVSRLAPVYTPGDGRLVRLRFDLPLDAPYVSHVPRLAQALGHASNAWWGHFTPGEACTDIMIQFIGHEPEIPPPGAPRLGGILAHATHPAIPALIGWINYWSAETRRLVGFSHPGPQSWAFRHVIPCEGGGIVLQLTEAPLDLEHPEHLAALEVAYDAFPAIHRANTGGG